MMQSCYVYILRCADGSLYTGWTDDLPRRLTAHNAGRGAKYTRARRPVTLLYTEYLPDKSAALRREAAIKRLPRAKKLALIRNQEVMQMENPILGLGHIGFVSPQPEALAAFYEALGFTFLGALPKDAPPEGQFIRYLRAPNGVTLELFRGEAGAPEGIPQGGFTHLSLTVRDVSAALALVVSAGGSVERTDGPIFVRDPDGNRLELMTRDTAL